MKPTRCNEIWPGGKAVGLEIRCERPKGHKRQVWHQHTDKNGERLQWSHKVERP